MSDISLQGTKALLKLLLDIFLEEFEETASRLPQEEVYLVKKDDPKLAAFRTSIGPFIERIMEEIPSCDSAKVLPILERCRKLEESIQKKRAQVAALTAYVEKQQETLVSLQEEEDQSEEDQSDEEM